MGCKRPIDPVILSEAKNLVFIDSLGIVRSPSICARDEILRFAQNDRVSRLLKGELHTHFIQRPKSI